MFQKPLAVFVFLAFAFSMAAAPGKSPASVKLSATEIADKNVAARGGLQAWRAVQTMKMEGEIGIGGNQRATLSVSVPTKNGESSILPKRPAEEMQVPFVMELARPRRVRFELQFNGQTAVQVFDGTNGWKLRPFLNRREVEPYTPEELKEAATQTELDGPLVDYAAKGTRIELVGTEKVEERDTYKLKLTKKDGDSIHVWIDAETFLEAKIEGRPRRLDGTMHPVEVYYRNYQVVDGLQIPFVVETRVLPVAQSALGLEDTPVPAERIIIEKALVNPKLEASLFTKPVIGPTTATPTPNVKPVATGRP
jgi:hypothetical protein